MLLKCLGTNSDGNCYILDNGNERLILDCGLSYKEILIGLDFNITNVVGVLVTHCHSDHAYSVKKFREVGIPVFTPYDDIHKNFNLRKCANFKAKAFALKDNNGNWVHTNGDGSECPCYGYYITHPNMGSLVYATDCQFIKWKFPNVNHFLIEANYNLDSYESDKKKGCHVIKGHQSIQGACKFLEANKTDALQNVILCHLSNDNGDPNYFIEEASKVVNSPIYIAKKGLLVSLGKE